MVSFLKGDEIYLKRSYAGQCDDVDGDHQIKLSKELVAYGKVDFRNNMIWFL